MTGNWKSFLIKETFSPELVEELGPYIDEGAQAALQGFRCSSKEHLTVLKGLLSQLNRKLPEDLLEELKEEAREIRDDFKWMGTKRGKYILAVNEWLEAFFDEFRSFPEFGDVVIGGHSEKEVIFVTGRVADLPTHQRLIAFIQAKTPPFKLRDAVVIGERSAASS